MKTITLSEKQYQLLEKFLVDYQDKLGNSSCNDLPDDLKEMFSKEEGELIAKQFAIMNNPDNPDGPSWPIFDFCLVYWLRKSIEQQSH